MRSFALCLSLTLILPLLPAQERGLIAFLCPGPSAGGGSDAIATVDPDNGLSRSIVLRGIHGGCRAGIHWLGEKEVVVAVDVVIEERFGYGVFPDLWRVAADGGTIRRLTRGRSPLQLAVAPEGNRVAYVTSQHSDLVVWEFEGDRMQPVSSGFSKVWDPAWSPDGKQLVFRGWKSGTSEEEGTYLVPAEGGEPRRVAGFLSHPAFTPDGRALVALEYAWPTGPKKVLFVDLSSGAQRAIAEGASSEDVPRLSPDGTRVVFVRADSQEIVVVGVAGGPGRVVGKGRTPRWSPDGRRLVCERDQHLYVIDLESGEERYLTEGTSPSW